MATTIEEASTPLDYLVIALKVRFSNSLKSVAWRGAKHIKHVILFL